MLLFVSLLVFLYFYLGNEYRNAAGKNKINAWSKQRFEDFYALEKNSLDLLFIGSSHSYCTFDPENFDSVMGVKSFQLGMPLQHPDSTYYTLLEALNYQKPETVVMELYWDVMNADFEVKQVETLFQVLDNDTLKKAYIDSFPLNEKVKYFITPIRFQQDFLAYKNSVLLKHIKDSFGLSPTVRQNTGEEYYRSKGYIYCDYVMSPEEHDEVLRSGGYDGRRWELSSVQKNYIKKIAELCADEGLNLIFVTAPVSNVLFQSMEHYDRIHNEIASLAEELGVEYLDFNLVNRDGNLFPDEMFRDARHLNDNGAKAANEYFIAWLSLHRQS